MSFKDLPKRSKPDLLHKALENRKHAVPVTSANSVNTDFMDQLGKMAEQIRIKDDIIQNLQNRIENGLQTNHDSEANGIIEKLNATVMQLQSNVVSLQNELQDRNEELRHYSNIEARLDKEVPDVNELLEMLLKRERDVQEAKNEKVLYMLQDKDSEISHLKDTLSNMEQDKLAMLENNEELMASLEESERERKLLFESNQTLSEEIENLKRSIIPLEQEALKTNEMERGVKRKLHDMELQCLHAEQEIAMHNERTSALTTELSEKSKKLICAENECEALRRLVKRQNISNGLHPDAFGLDFAQLEQKYSNTNEQLQKALADLQKFKSSSDEFEEELMVCRDQLKVATLGGTESELDMLKSRIKILEQHLKQAEMQKKEMKSTFDQEIEKLQKNISKSKAEKSIPSKSPRKGESSATLSIDVLKDQIANLETNVSVLKARNKTLESECLLLDNQNKDLRSHYEQIVLDSDFNKGKPPEPRKKRVTFDLPSPYDPVIDRNDELNMADSISASFLRGQVENLKKEFTLKNRLVRELENKNSDLERRLATATALYQETTESCVKLDSQLHQLQVQCSDRVRTQNHSNSTSNTFNTNKEMASLHSKVYQATLREEHAMKRVRELENQLSKLQNDSKDELNSVKLAVSDLSKLVNVDEDLNLEENCKQENSMQRALSQHQTALRQVSKTLSEKEVEIAKCHQKVLSLESDYASAKLSIESLKVELESTRRQHAQQILFLNEEAKIRNENSTRCDDTSKNHAVDLNEWITEGSSVAELVSRISLFESMLKFEKTENESLRKALSSLSSVKPPIHSPFKAESIDRDSALLRMAERNELLEKQIQSLQSHLVLQTGSLPVENSNNPVESVSVADHVPLLLSVESLKLLTGRQANQLLAVSNELEDTKNHAFAVHQELKLLKEKHFNCVENDRTLSQEIVTLKDEVQSLRSQLDDLKLISNIGNSCIKSDLFRKKFVEPVISLNTNAKESHHFHQLEQKYDQLVLTLEERDSQIKTLVETVDVLQFSLPDSSGISNPQVVLLQSQLESCKISEKIISSSNESLLEHYSKQCRIASDVILKLEETEKNLQIRADECIFLENKYQLLERKMEELERISDKKGLLLIEAESRITKMHSDLELVKAESRNHQNELHFLRSRLLSQQSKESLSNKSIDSTKVLSDKSKLNESIDVSEIFEYSASENHLALPIHNEMIGDLSTLRQFVSKVDLNINKNQAPVLVEFLDKLVSIILQQDSSATRHSIRIFRLQDLYQKQVSQIDCLKSEMEIMRISNKQLHSLLSEQHSNWSKSYTSLLSQRNSEVFQKNQELLSCQKRADLQTREIASLEMKLKSCATKCESLITQKQRMVYQLELARTESVTSDNHLKKDDSMPPLENIEQIKQDIEIFLQDEIKRLFGRLTDNVDPLTDGINPSHHLSTVSSLLEQLSSAKLSERSWAEKFSHETERNNALMLQYSSIKNQLESLLENYSKCNDTNVNAERELTIAHEAVAVEPLLSTKITLNEISLDSAAFVAMEQKLILLEKEKLDIRSFYESHLESLKTAHEKSSDDIFQQYRRDIESVSKQYSENLKAFISRNSDSKVSSPILSQVHAFRIKELEQLYETSQSVLKQTQVKLQNSISHSADLRYQLQDASFELSNKQKCIESLSASLDTSIFTDMKNAKYNNISTMLLKLLASSKMSELEAWSRYKASVNAEIHLREKLASREERILQLKQQNFNRHVNSPDLGFFENVDLETINSENVFACDNALQLQYLLFRFMGELNCSKVRSLKIIEKLSSSGPNSSEFKSIFESVSRKENRELELIRKINVLEKSESELKESLKMVTSILNKSSELPKTQKSMPSKLESSHEKRNSENNATKSHSILHGNVSESECKIFPAATFTAHNLLSNSSKSAVLDHTLSLVEVRTTLSALVDDYENLYKNHQVFYNLLIKLGFSADELLLTEPVLISNSKSKIEKKPGIESLIKQIDSLAHKLEQEKIMNENLKLESEAKESSLILAEKEALDLYRSTMVQVNLLRHENEELKLLLSKFDRADCSESNEFLSIETNGVDDEVLKLKEQVTSLKSSADLQFELMKNRFLTAIADKKVLSLSESDLVEEVVSIHESLLKAKIEKAQVELYNKLAAIQFKKFKTEQSNILNQLDVVKMQHEKEVIQINKELNDCKGELVQFSETKKKLAESEYQNTVLIAKLDDIGKRFEALDFQYNAQELDRKSQLHVLAGSLESRLEEMGLKLLDSSKKYELLFSEKSSLERELDSKSRKFQTERLENDLKYQSLVEKLGLLQNERNQFSESLKNSKIDFENNMLVISNEFQKEKMLLNSEISELRVKLGVSVDEISSLTTKSASLQVTIDSKEIEIKALASKILSVSKEHQARYLALATDLKEQKILHNRFAAVYDKHVSYLRDLLNQKQTNYCDNVEMTQYKALCNVLRAEVEQLSKSKVTPALFDTGAFNDTVNGMDVSILDELESKDLALHTNNLLIMKCSLAELESSNLKKQLSLDEDKTNSLLIQFHDCEVRNADLLRENRQLQNLLNGARKDRADYQQSQMEILTKRSEVAENKLSTANDQLNDLKKSLRTSKDELARKTQLLQHMKEQLAVATETLSVLEPQLKDRDTELTKFRKTISIKDSSISEMKERISVLSDSIMECESLYKKESTKTRQLQLENNRKDGIILELKLKLEDNINGQPKKDTHPEASNQKSEEIVLALKTALSKAKSDLERKDSYTNTLKSHLLKVEEDLLKAENQLTAMEQTNESKAKSFKLREKSLKDEIKDLTVKSGMTSLLKQSFKHLAVRVLDMIDRVSRSKSEPIKSELIKSDKWFSNDPLLSQFSKEELKAFMSVEKEKENNSIDSLVDILSIDDISAGFSQLSRLFSPSIRTELQQIFSLIDQATGPEGANLLIKRFMKLIETTNKNFRE